MATYALNPSFHYVVNRKTDVAYIITPQGQRSMVNCDAIDLLEEGFSDNQPAPKHSDFFNSAIQLGWLIPKIEHDATIRYVDTEIHLRRIQYELNLFCNLECAHCYCGANPRASKGQSTAFVKDVIDQASDMGVIIMDYTGGEPLARPDIFEILEYTRTKNMLPELYTNGTLIDDAVANRLVEVGVRNIQTSLDALTPELHDRFRGKIGAFAKTIRGIQAAKKAGINISVSVTVHRENQHEIPALVDYLTNDLEVPFNLDRIIPAGRAVGNDTISMTNEEFYKLAYDLFKGKRAPLAKVCDSPSSRMSDSQIEPECGVGISYLFIKHNGKVVVCPTMTEAESPDFVAGNLQESSLAEIWYHHPTFEKYRHVQCENIRVCPAAKSCTGGCRSNAYILHGSVDSPDEFYCNIYKNPDDAYKSSAALKILHS